MNSVMDQTQLAEKRYGAKPKTIKTEIRLSNKKHKNKVKNWKK